MSHLEKCHSCGNETEYYCRDCAKPVCDNCTVPYTQFNQVDYTKCDDCEGHHQQIVAQEFHQNQLDEAEAEKRRIARAEKARLYYNSHAQVEKRAQIKLAKEAEMKEWRSRQADIFAEVLRGFFGVK